MRGYHCFPQDTVRALSAHIVGQPEAIDVMTVQIRQQVRRLQAAIASGTWTHVADRREMRPCVLVGPSGCGKTALAALAARISGFSHVTEDCTGQTAVGWVGRSASDIVASLIHASHSSPTMAAWSCVVLDECDKLKQRTAHGNSDIGGIEAQQQLLTLVEGSTVACEYPTSGPREARTSFTFGTGNTLLTCCGVFDELEEIIRRRLGMSRRIGFGATSEPAGAEESYDTLCQVEPEDLVQFGMIPEFVGRLGEIVIMRPLGREQLRDILMLEADEAPLQVLRRAAEREGVRLVVTDGLIDAVVTEAERRGLGARALGSVLARITRRLFLEVPTRVNPCCTGTYTVELDADALVDGTFKLSYRDARSPRRRRSSGYVTPDDLEAEA
jgi:ATP-dependent Clp protease ATP-binding subunit ClpX